MGVLQKSKEHNEDDEAEVTVTVPRFNEESEEAARPVVPLGQVNDAGAAPAPTARPRVAARPARAAWSRGLTLALAVAAGVLVGAVGAVYLVTRQATPAATREKSAETSAAAPEPSPTPRAADVPAAPPGAQTKPEVRSVPSPREEPERVRGEDEGHHNRDEKKREERARKEEERRRREDEKQAERERKEAEKRAERQRDSEEGGEKKARLVDTITGKP